MMIMVKLLPWLLLTWCLRSYHWWSRLPLSKQALWTTTFKFPLSLFCLYDSFISVVLLVGSSFFLQACTHMYIFFYHTFPKNDIFLHKYIHSMIGLPFFDTVNQHTYYIFHYSYVSIVVVLYILLLSWETKEKGEVIFYFFFWLFMLYLGFSSGYIWLLLR